jgi:hypothetical protein
MQPGSRRLFVQPLRDQYFIELADQRQETLRESKLAPQPLSEAEAELRQMAEELDKLD